MKKLLLLLTLLSSFSEAVIVGPLPYTIVNGAPVDATPIMANYNWILNQTNANAASLSGGSFTGPVTLGAGLAGNLLFNTSGSFIRGDLTNASLIARLMFQTSTGNSLSSLGIVPSGSATQSDFTTYNAAVATNAGFTAMTTTATDSRFSADRAGAGTYLPMTWYTSGAERMRLDTSGNLGLGVTPGGTYKLEIGSGSTLAKATINGNGSGSGGGGFFSIQNAGSPSVAVGNASALYGGTYDAKGVIYSSAALSFASLGSEKMLLDTSGNLGIGTTPVGGWQLEVGSGASTNQARINGANSGAGGGSFFAVANGGTSIVAVGNYSHIYGGAYDATGAIYSANALSIAAGGSEKIKIDTSGNFGLGMTPTSKLDINSATNNGLRTTDGTSTSIFYNNGASGALVGTTSNHPLSLYTNNTAKVVIATSGQIDAIGVARTVVKAADTNRNSVTALAADPDLTFTLAATSVYEVEFNIAIRGTTTSAMGYNFAFPYSGTLDATAGIGGMASSSCAVVTTQMYAAIVGAASSGSCSTVYTTVNAFNDSILAHLIVYTSTAGNIAFSWAQLSSQANNLTVKRGSYMKITKLQ